MTECAECNACRVEVRVNEEFCPTCGAFSGYPNVKVASVGRSQLLMRADQARADAARRGAAPALRMLENAARNTRAVVNVSPAFSHHLLTSDTPMYASYQRQIAAATRRPASEADDRERVAVEAKLYGSASHNVIYAALSADGRGMTSYGSVVLMLREIAIRERATVLEENSYTFARKHAIQLLGPVPPGFLGTWQDREHVVVAKLASHLDSDITPTRLEKLLLVSEGDRATDDFVEVHIWRGFNRAAIDGVQAPPVVPDAEEALLLALAEEKARGQEIPWSAGAD